MTPSLLQSLLNLQHFLVDAICLACIMGPVKSQFNITVERQAMVLSFLIVLYNTLAFCTQWTTGLCCDILKNDKPVHIAYTVILLIGAAVCPWSPIAGITLIGIGNSLFHVVGGRYVIQHSSMKAAPFGLFVAPGALGVYIGTAFSELLWLYCTVLLLNAVIITTQIKNETEAMPSLKEDAKAKGKTRLQSIIVMLVLFCIICRAASGSVSLQGYQFAAPWRWMPVAFIFLGKSLGGFIGDHWSIGLAGTLALLAGTVCLAFGRNETTFLAGQFLMNLLMPLTLYLLASVYPDYPGMAFGMAASVLFPGSLIRLTWNPQLVLLILSIGSILCFGTACLLLKRINGKVEDTIS